MPYLLMLVGAVIVGLGIFQLNLSHDSSVETIRLNDTIKTLQRSIDAISERSVEDIAVARSEAANNENELKTTLFDLDTCMQTVSGIRNEAMRKEEEVTKLTDQLSRSWRETARAKAKENKEHEVQ